MDFSPIINGKFNIFSKTGKINHEIHEKARKWNIFYHKDTENTE